MTLNRWYLVQMAWSVYIFRICNIFWKHFLLVSYKLRVFVGLSRTDCVDLFLTNCVVCTLHKLRECASYKSRGHAICKWMSLVQIAWRNRDVSRTNRIISVCFSSVGFSSELHVLDVFLERAISCF